MQKRTHVDKTFVSGLSICICNSIASWRNHDWTNRIIDIQCRKNVSFCQWNKKTTFFVVLIQSRSLIVSTLKLPLLLEHPNSAHTVFHAAASIGFTIKLLEALVWFFIVTSAPKFLVQCINHELGQQSANPIQTSNKYPDFLCWLRSSSLPQFEHFTYLRNQKSSLSHTFGIILCMRMFLILSRSWNTYFRTHLFINH